MRRPRSSNRRGGFTLLEVLISSILAIAVLGAAAVVSSTTASAYRNTSLRTDLGNRARRALDRVALELASSSETVVIPATETPGWTDDMQFCQALGVTGDVIDWSPLLQFAFEYELGEIDDGLDNDGDGLVDEGNLVMRRDVGLATETTVILCSGVTELLQGELPALGDENGNGLDDEKGFCLERDGDVVTIRLTLARRDPRGAMATQTVETSVRLRN